MDLVREHMPLARQLAASLARRLCRPQLEDLEQEAAVGLIEAARSYDPSRGVPFGAYARRRVLGQMLDYLRRTDHLGRPHRAEVRRGQAAAVRLVSLERLRRQRSRDGGHGDPMADPSQEEAVDLLTWRELPDDLLRGLLPRERLALVLYYCDELTMAEIGRSLGVTESSVSLTISQAVAWLRWARAGSQANDA